MPKAPLHRGLQLHHLQAVKAHVHGLHELLKRRLGFLPAGQVAVQPRVSVYLCGKEGLVENAERILSNIFVIPLGRHGHIDLFKARAIHQGVRRREKRV